jgi:carbon starvation protein CstA
MRRAMLWTFVAAIIPMALILPRGPYRNAWVLIVGVVLSAIIIIRVTPVFIRAWPELRDAWREGQEKRRLARAKRP